MNKIYRLIWDSSRQMLIPVSELSASHGKKSVTGSVENHPRFIFRLKTIVIVLAVLQGVIFVPHANAFLGDGGAYCSSADLNSGICTTTGSSTSGTIAIGNGSKSGDYSVALGLNALSYSSNAVAIGHNAKSTYQAISIGMDSSAIGNNSISIGSGGSTVETRGGVSLGFHNSLVKTLAPGDYDWNQMALGNENIVDAGGRGMTIGSWNRIYSKSNSGAGDAGTLAMGFDNTISESQGSYLFGGSSTINNSKNSILIGQFGTVKQAQDAIVIGSNNSATAEKVIAIGNKASANMSSAIAFGNNTQATFADSVAIGSNSVTSNVVKTTGATIAGTTYSFAGKAPGSTVSIGVANAERTLTNLAAGQVMSTSTDAVNGSQLFATNSAVNSLYNSVTGLSDDALLWDSSKNAYSATHGTAATNKITNVAAGTLSSSSTDAVNGSQLYATNQNVATNNANITKNSNAITTLADTPLRFAANSGYVDKKLGETLSVQGGKTNSGTYSAGNIATEVDKTGNLIIQMADNPEFNSTIIGGATTLDKNGLTVNNGPSVLVSGISAGSKKITNVAAADLNSTSTDAVNGSQLYATNQNVATNTNNIANVDASVKNIYDTGTKYFHANSYGADSVATGLDSVAIGMGAVAVNANDIALGAGSTTTNTVGTSDATIAGTKYTFAGNTPKSTLSIGSLGNERTITNVAAGRLSASSTDAVNGSQLFATNTAVDSLYNNISGLQSDALLWDANLNAFSASHGTNVENKITNVAAGDLTDVSTDAVNGSQLKATNDQVATNTTNIAQNTQDIANVDNRVTNIYDTGTKYFHANSYGADSVATGLDSVAIGMGAVAVNANDIALGAGSTTTNTVGTSDATIAGTKYTFAGNTPKSTLSIGSLGNERTITNVAAGRLSEFSTDAVNGSQLYATNRAINGIYVDVQGLQDDALLWDPALNAFSASHGTKTINKITNVAAGELSDTSTDAVNGSQLHATNVKVENIDNRLVNVEDVVYGNIVPTMRYLKVNSNGTEASASGADAIALGQGTVASGDNSVATGNGAQASGSGSIASGHNSNAAGEASVAIGENASVTANNSVALGAGSVADRDNTVSVGSSGNERQITNVAAGTEDTDAVNVSQLKAVSGDVTNLGNTVNNIANGTDGMFQVNNTDNHAKPIVTGTNAVAGGAGSTASGNNSMAVGTLASSSGENSVALGNGSSSKASNSVALGANSVADRDNSVSVGFAGSERQITNVAAGTELTDAVNVSQLKQTESSANQYTNKQFNALKNMVNDQKDKLSAGIAGAMAMSGLPQPYSPGASMVGMAGGTYQGESAIALGVSTISDNGKWVTKLSGSTNSQGDFGAAIGIGYQW